MDSRINSLLEEIDERMAQDWSAGEAGVLEDYLQGVAQVLVKHAGLDLDEAQGVVRDAVAEVIQEGILSELPQGRAGQEAWIQEAHDFGIVGYMLGALRS